MYQNGIHHPLCHPETGMDCYRLVTIFRHPVIECPLCSGLLDPRTYTGEFPPDGSTPTVDDLVAALATSVERVRLKYGLAVGMLADELGCPPDIVLARIDVIYAVTEHTPFKVGGE